MGPGAEEPVEAHLVDDSSFQTQAGRPVAQPASFQLGVLGPVGVALGAGAGQLHLALEVQALLRAHLGQAHHDRDGPAPWGTSGAEVSTPLGLVVGERW